MRLRPATLALMLAAAAGGCAGSARSGAAPRPFEPTDRVDVVNLQAMPTAINWDDRPGADGLRVRVFLFQVDRPEPVRVRGALEFLLYEGALGGEELAAAEPIRDWTFSGEELARHQERHLVGWGYAFALGWGAEGPDAPRVTLVARYRPPRGRPRLSSPIAIAMKST